MAEADAIERADTPATEESLARDLAALGVAPGTVLLVHASLSALGWVCGGPVAVLGALRRVLGPSGTLVMPTMSGDYSEPSLWRSPPVPEAWWPVIRAHLPAFDPDLTPTRMMGVIVDTFRQLPGVQRSDHPHTSFAALGPHADRIVAGHALECAMGEQSPLARLYDLDAHVLLLGVGHERNSSLHLAEYRAEWPGKRFVEHGAPVRSDGGREWVTYDDLDTDDDDFARIGEAFAPHETLGRVACAAARLFRQVALVDFAARWMGANRGTEG